MAFSATALGLASLAIGAASAVTSYVGQQQQASAQAAYQDAQSKEYARVNELNNQAAIKEYTEQSAAERIKQMQEQAAASTETQNIQKEALQKKGTMLASTNTAGMALDALMADYDRTEAEQKELVRRQYEFGAIDSGLALDGYRERTQNRINGQQSYIQAPVSNPSGLGLILGIGSAGLNGYTTYQKYKGKE